MSPLPPSRTLLSLDPDVLLLIFQFVRHKRSLIRLSTTCRWLRTLCMPFLFTWIRVQPGDFTPQTFIPEDLRQHVRTLEFTRSCHFVSVPGELLFEPRKRHRLPPGPCVYDGPQHPFLLDALRGMTRLQNLVVDTPFGAGLPFWILNAILSAPHLSNIQFGPSICLAPEDDLTFPKRVRLTGPISSLTTFRRSLPYYVPYSRSPDETDILYRLFMQIHQTLRVSEMTSDTAPLKAFRMNDWPCLRELVLRGGPRRPSSNSMMEAFARMPNLRILIVEMALRTGTGPRLICPPGWSGGCPWPGLKTLSVSHPHPDDELYMHLPGSLQRLTLRCYPRHYVAMEPIPGGRECYMDSRQWTSPLLSSTEMLRVLGRCGPSLVHLRHLDIEFATSEDDVRLLRHIASAFPSLTFLQLLRYHKGRKHVAASLANMGNALAPLKRLRLLRVHLDLDSAETGNKTSELLRPLAEPLSATVRFVCILSLRPAASEWLAHRVVRDPSTGTLVELQYRQECLNIDGYRQHEGFNPCRPRRWGGYPMQELPVDLRRSPLFQV